MYKTIAVTKKTEISAPNFHYVNDESDFAIPQRAKLNIDMNEVAKIKAERDELYTRIYPNRK